MGNYSRHHRPYQSKSSFSWIWIPVLIGFISLVGYAIYEWNYSVALSKKSSDISSREKFTVEKGSTLSTVLENLETQTFISSAWAAKRYLKKNNLDTKIVAGTHYIAHSMTIPEIMNVLTSAIPTEKILIPEGLSIEEIDTRLSEKHGLKKGEFLLCVQKTCDFSAFDFLPSDRSTWEGYFFPSTYEFVKDAFTAEELAKKMLERFEKKIKSIGLQNNKRTLEELVIMASIIEKESSSHQGDESKTISGILWNRIDAQIPLGADATLRYGIKNSTEALKVSELQSENPFNTRVHKGLPPHAISNPGEHSLLAAANPSKTSYLFYLHDTDKKIRYAITNQQHEANKEKYCGGSCE